MPTIELIGLIGSILLRLVAVSAILYLLYTVLRRLSGSDQIATALRMQEYFRGKVYPRNELAPYLQKIRLAKKLLVDLNRKDRAQLEALRRKQKHPVDWERVEQEYHSRYYERTCQRIGDKNAFTTLEHWYREEEWIQDILAGNAPQLMVLSTPADLLKVQAARRRAANHSANKVKNPKQTDKSE